MANQLEVSDVFEGNSIVEKLLEQLEESFPPVNPHPDNPTNLIMYRSGQRSVVEFIQSIIEE
jgi:hypothetical protein